MCPDPSVKEQNQPIEWSVDPENLERETFLNKKEDQISMVKRLISTWNKTIQKTSPYIMK